jgi:hypothetical protein
MALPTDSQERKDTPVWSGFVVYFPDAIVAVAQLSKWSDRKHNPDKPLDAAPTWAKHKSQDEEDAGMRHAIEPLLIGGSDYDPEDGFAHKVKKAWRAMADLQRFLAAGNLARAFTPGPGGIRIPCAGAPTQADMDACLRRAGVRAAEIIATMDRCSECENLLPFHKANCSHNFKRVAPADEVIYQTPGHGEAPEIDHELRPVTATELDPKWQEPRRAVPAVFCPQCGCESPLHFAGCLSRSANGGM